MNRTIVLSCFSGNGMLLLLILLFFGIAAVPTPKPTQVIPDITTTTRASSSSSSYYTTTTATGDTGTTMAISATTQLQSNISLFRTDLPQGSSNNEDSPAIINNENVTETEIVITEARHGKSLHHHHNNQDLIAKNGDNSAASSPLDVTTTTERTAVSASSSSDFTAKLATTEFDDEVQQLGEGDASPAPKLDGEVNAEAKPQELTEPRLQFVPPPATVPTEKDKVIQRIFGGECDFEHWNRCSRIDFWGGDYLVPDKNNPGKFIVKHHKIRCLETPKHTLCLRNGWTVARCHMLCMSQCNVEFRMNYESLVSHEGDCKLPILT